MNRYLFESLLLLLLLLRPCSSAKCEQSCNKSSVPYPFGFSSDCQIRLNCTDNIIQIGSFTVHNVTPDHIQINLPPKCNRSIYTLIPFFGQNYAPTWRNGLLLQNCAKKLDGCEIPHALLDTQFNLSQGCDETQCFSKEKTNGSHSGNSGNSFLAYDQVMQKGCKFFYSSVTADNKSSSVFSLEFQTVQLGWWLEGDCNCSAHANCTKIASPVNRKASFRCRCGDGYEGDGFVAGNGCRRVVSHCNPSKYLSDRCRTAKRFGVLIGGIVTIAFIITGFALLWCYIKRRSTSIRAKNSTKHLLSEAGGEGFSVPFYSYKEIEKATLCFSEKYRLGTGAYGTVYAGKLHNDEWVAIKKIRYRDRDGTDQVMNEIKLVSSVSHPNLVRLLGFCIEKGEQILVYEFMPNGTLCQHLQRERGTGLPWTIRLNIACETAQAIAHLHSAIDPPIYHRDIKSSNILLDHNLSSKVADFGLSRLGIVETSHISTAPQGTPGYLDPQYHQNFHLSDKSDVYSFGVVLAEIITAMKVVDFSRPVNEVNLAGLFVEKIRNGCLDDIIDPFLEPNRDAWTLSSVHRVAELAFRCLSFHRDMRPCMKEAAEDLEQIKLSGWAPLEEDISAPSSVASMASCRSSLSNVSEMSKMVALRKLKTESRSLVVPPRNDLVISTKVGRDCSPVSVQHTWPSNRSSPSTNSLFSIAIP